MLGHSPARRGRRAACGSRFVTRTASRAATRRVRETDDEWRIILGQRLTDYQSQSDLTNILPGETPMIRDRELFLGATGKLTT
jgi:hypothetical protein